MYKTKPCSQSGAGSRYKPIRNPIRLTYWLIQGGYAGIVTYTTRILVLPSAVCVNLKRGEIVARFFNTNKQWTVLSCLFEVYLKYNHIQGKSRLSNFTASFYEKYTM